jgi:uncharacterized protein YjaZ
VGADQGPCAFCFIPAPALFVLEPLLPTFIKCKKEIWSEEMGIIRTAEWLEEDFDRPTRICEKLLPVFKGQNAKEIYLQLSQFGMYSPSKASRDSYKSLSKNKFWDKVELIFQLYKRKWGGPDIPIYLFPIDLRVGFFSRKEKIKGGVSFPDKMFLFLSDKVTKKELEALFVHEYHHVCRLNMQTKKFEDYTLMDSIIIEGLAEYAVLVNCGRQYLAEWCSMYSEKEIIELWAKYLQDQLDKKKHERGHDQLLFGGGRIPNLLGYAVGFKIVEGYYTNHHYSIKQSFSLPATKYIEEENIFTEKKPTE